MVPNTVCSNCEKQIYKAPYALNHHKIFFCNMTCLKSFYKKKSKTITVNCNYCDKKINKTSSQQRNSKTGLFFCNNLCKNRYLAKNKRWRNFEDNVFHHRSRQNILFEKIKYTCQKCGYNKNKKMLDIHHYDHDHCNNNYNNLRILCVWCHMRHHRLKEEYDLPEIISNESMEKEIKLFIENKIKNNNEKRKNKGRKLLLKICLFCQKEFKTKDIKQKCCSIKCNSINKRKVKNRPSIEVLLQEIEETNYCAVGRKYGVSDNAIRRWIK
jgi:hypothetical protein